MTSRCARAFHLLLRASLELDYSAAQFPHARLSAPSKILVTCRVKPLRGVSLFPFFSAALASVAFTIELNAGCKGWSGQGMEREGECLGKAGGTLEQATRVYGC